MNKVVLQEMTHQEMRETNGGCCLIKLCILLKIIFGCRRPGEGGGGGEEPGTGTGED